MIRFAALDPALSNVGLAKFDLCPRTLELTLVGTRLVETEGEVAKKPRKPRKGELKTVARRPKGTPKPPAPPRNLDDLRRAREITAALREWLADCELVVSEVPTGAQSSRAATAFGIVVGVLAGLTIPLVDVTPTETKLAVPGGHAQLDKAAIIAWAVERWPEAGWSFTIRKGVKRWGASNEHVADACAIAHAGATKPAFAAFLSARV